MKTPDQIKPNYAMYPDLAKIAQQHGYALAVHGSLARDFDLIAVPWGQTLSPVSDVLAAITAHFSVTVSPDSPALRAHGRLAYTLNIGWGECALDLSFLPINS